MSNKQSQGKETSMDKIREIIKMHHANFSQSKIGRCLRTSRTTVRKFITAAEKNNLTIDDVENLSDRELASLLDMDKPRGNRSNRKQDVDFAQVHRELSDPMVTLQLLHDEYCASHEGACYGYSWFCEKYKEWKRPLNATLRKSYKAGEYLFQDFSGKNLYYYDRALGKEIKTELYVAVLGCSNYTYAEAMASQKLPEWLKANINTFEYFGGAPSVLVPDNLKSATSRACIYDPDINDSFWTMAKHYGSVVLPARSGRARDKAKVEGAVLIAQRWILARLRKHKFFSLEEINDKIRNLVEQMNTKPLQKLGMSRRELYEKVERASMKPLPDKRWELAFFKKAKVHIDYHVELEKVYYSVPYKLIGERVVIRYTATTVEILFENTRVASHLRSFQKGSAVTVDAHRPSKHKAVIEWNPERLKRWALAIGPKASDTVKAVFGHYKNEDHGIRRVLGMLSLAQKYGDETLEDAFSKIQSPTFARVKHLKALLKDKPVISKTQKRKGKNRNIRGPKYFVKGKTHLTERKVIN